MKKNRFTLITFLGMLFFLVIMACEKAPQLSGVSQEADSEQLQGLYDELEALSNKYPCQDIKEWNFSPLGAKACGGPTMYIAYSSKLNTSSFLKKVKVYTNLQNDYNIKWGIVSDCAYLTPPSHLVCENGKPKMIWANYNALESRE